jgi:hypothetical protein
MYNDVEGSGMTLGECENLFGRNITIRGDVIAAIFQDIESGLTRPK